MMELILNFHGVGEAPAGTPSSELSYWWKEAPFLEALDRIATAKASLAVPVSITFDDGNASDAKIALPALVKRGLRASFFVCAGRVGARDYLDASAIRDLLSAGMIVGSHGMHHTDWTNLDISELNDEITSARNLLQQMCGREIVDVAIPFGRYNRAVLKRLRSETFQRIYTSDGGLASPKAWLQPRNTLQGTDQCIDIQCMLSNVNAPLRRARRLAKRIHRQFV
jgi:peptidoglycan/xylan/chitin deacetylase (PgdA/CDA1 family)